jgi:protein-L-isoaspartate(D-aspartate) O-methyltransferase
MTSTVDYRRRLADELTDKGTIHSSWLRQAFTDIPREVFVPRFHRSEPGREGIIDGTDPEKREQWLDGIYTDQVLVVQYTPAPAMHGPGAPTSSSSMPTVMAGMLEALDVQPGHRVLEIGTGTGYNTALLCHRVGADNVASVELDPALAYSAGRALASIGLHPTVRAGDGAAGFAHAAPYDRIIATAAADHIPPDWITQLTPGGVIVTDLRGSLAGGILRLTATTESDTDEPATEVDTVHGRFLNLPGAFMPMRTHVDQPSRDGEDWDKIVYNHTNPHQGSTKINPVLITQGRSLRLLTQLHLAGRRLRGFLRSADDTELSGVAIDGSWFAVDLQPDRDGRYGVAQGGPQRLWDTVEVAHATWERLSRPSIEQFGVTAHDNLYTQHVWFDHPDSGDYRWPLPL